MDRIHDLMSLLKSSLKLEFPTYTFVEAEAVAGEPTLALSVDASPTTREQTAFIRILQKSYTGYPTATLSLQPLGGPSVIQLALENADVAVLGAAAGISYWDAIDLGKLISRIKDLTCDIEIYMSANTVVPVIGTLIAGNLVGEIKVNSRIPNMGQ